jgi:DNA-binding response OmpR family regulator
MKLLLVEDEADLRRSLSRALADEGFAVDTADDGEEALHRAVEIEYDAIVLDLMLPRRDGSSVLRALRRAGRVTPVIVLTARDTLDDCVASLNLGADDFLTKPFDLAELVARIRALIRRAAADPSPERHVGPVRIDLAGRRVYRDGDEVELTPREFGILELLLRRQGDVVPRATILDHLYDDDSELMSNAIDVHVAALRRKLGAELIQTRRGLGYLIDG